VGASAAIEHFDRAIQASRQLGVDPDAELLRLNGQAHDLAGDFASAESAYPAARDAARALGDTPTEWQALSILEFSFGGRECKSYDHCPGGLSTFCWTRALLASLGTHG
jgi:hypothetical protein